MSKFLEYKLRMKAEGYSNAEIAEFINASPKLMQWAVEHQQQKSNVVPVAPTESEAFNARRNEKTRKGVAEGRLLGATLNLDEPVPSTFMGLPVPSLGKVAGGFWDWTGKAAGGMVGGMADQFAAAPTAGKAAYLMYPPALLQKSMVEGAVEGVKSEAARAGELLDQPPGQTILPKVEGTSRAIASMVPMFGPMLTEISKDIGEGEIERAAGKVGTLFIPAGGRGAKAGAKAGAGKLRGAIYSASEEAPTSAVRQAIEASRAGKMVFDLVREAQHQQRYNKALTEFTDLHEGLIKQEEGLIRTIGDPDVPAEAVGAQTGETIAAHKAITGKIYNMVEDVIGSKEVERMADVPTLDKKTGKPLLYDPSDQAATKQQLTTVMEGGLPIDLKPYAKRFRSVVARLNQQSSIMDAPGLGSLRAQAEDILRVIEDPNYTPNYSQLKETKTLMQDIASKGDELLPKLKGKLTNDIIGTFSEAIEASVEKAVAAGTIPSNILKLLKGANKRYALLHRTGVKELLDLATNDPQAAHRMLINPKTPIQDLRDIRAVVGGKVFKAMTARGLGEDLIASIREFEPLEMKTLSGAGTPVVGRQLGAILERTINLLDRKGNLVELFPETLKEMRQLAAEARRGKKFVPSRMGVADPVNVKTTTPEAGFLKGTLDVLSNPGRMGLVGGGFGGTLGGLHGFNPGQMTLYGAVSGVAGVAVAYQFEKAIFRLAQLMTTKPTAKLVLNYERALSSGKQAVIDAAGMRLMAAVAALDKPEEQATTPGVPPVPPVPDLYPPKRPQP